EDLLPIIQRMKEELRMPVYFRQQEMIAGSSIGVVIWNPSYEDPDDLIRAADTAMYQAKETGRGCHCIFDESMHTQILRAVKNEADLRAAIRERSFSMAYQPVVELRTGALISLEALLRWHHPERGTLLPQEFLSIAESSGLIVPVGEIALDEVCSQISRWQAPGHPAADLPVSVNISPRQLLEPDFLKSVLGRLGQWRIPSDSLILEITENALIANPSAAKLMMRKLRGIGLELYLDDFGAGWSSLRHLTTLPVQGFKIDTGFISELSENSADLAVVRSLTTLAHSLGMKVVAEGLERCDQWCLLEETGCDDAQGFYIAAPLEPDALAEFLEDLEHGSCMLPRVERAVRKSPSTVDEPRPVRNAAPVSRLARTPLCTE
ncbi:MAG: EAL domain-containing protein, partial [Thermoleophilia bacterium]|nr:EAL domain-containing protein [Thermoleophilia bacterium]